MTKLLDRSPEGRQRRKVLALTLLVITAILAVVAFAWWNSLPDEDPGSRGVEDVAEEVEKIAE